MNVETFHQLSEDLKLKVLMTTASVVSERKDNESRAFLYYLGSFYAIVKYNSQTDELLDIDAFSECDRKYRIEWRILRVLPGLQRLMREKVEGLL